MRTHRLLEIDRAKAIAISLVVFGHIGVRSPFYGNDFYVLIKYLIYKFHMPFFMFLSGAVFYYNYKPIKSLANYKDFTKQKIVRLFPSFFIFGIVILFGKEIASLFLHVDRMPSGFFVELKYLFLYPFESVSRSLWYIYVLFEFYLLFPLALKYFRHNHTLLLIFCAVLHIALYFYDITNFMMLDRFMEYTLYFSIGIAAIHAHDQFKPAVLKYAKLFYIIFLISLFITPYVSKDFSKTIIGILSIPALYALVHEKAISFFDSILLTIGEYTFTIYLFNTIFIGITKSLVLVFLPPDQLGFIVFFSISLTLGIYGPILIHKYFLSKFHYLSIISK